MTTTLTLDSKYVTVLEALGNVEDALKDAVRGYAMTHISERIGQIQHEILRLQSRPGAPHRRRIAHQDVGLAVAVHVLHPHAGRA